MTHTYAVLEVPSAVYAAVRALLARADYQHAFHANGDGEVIDMHGIALRSKGGSLTTDITVSTLLSSQTKEGRIDFTLNGELTQMDLDKAREVVSMLQGAIEAAISDELVFRFLTEKVGMKPELASAALVDFREMRQGSRGLVNPH
jgi:NAD-dependent DNA ligase